MGNKELVIHGDFCSFCRRFFCCCCCFIYMNGGQWQRCCELGCCCCAFIWRAMTLVSCRCLPAIVHSFVHLEHRFVFCSFSTKHQSETNTQDFYFLKTFADCAAAAAKEPLWSCRIIKSTEKLLGFFRWYGKCYFFALSFLDWFSWRRKSEFDGFHCRRKSTTMYIQVEQTLAHTEDQNQLVSSRSESIKWLFRSMCCCCSLVLSRLCVNIEPTITKIDENVVSIKIFCSK